MQKIIIPAKLAGNEHNATPAVVEALEKLCKTGGTLAFEKGEYHFRPEGAYKHFVGISNNSAGEKSIAFPIIGAKHITVEGGGSTFVFYGGVLPFWIKDSCGIEVKNLNYDIPVSPIAVMRITEVSEEGFKLEIDREKTPYRVESGELIFLANGGERRGQFALHATERLFIRYLYSGVHNTPAGNLPVPFMHTVAREVEGGVHMTYLDTTQEKCRFHEGETVHSTLFGGRSTCACLIDGSKEVKIKDFCVRRCIGMGIVGQLAEDIEIDGFCSDESAHGEGWTLTADALHFINCRGKLDIHNCRISHTKDDVINVHGNYTVLNRVEEGGLIVDIKHHEQAWFNLYKKGDRLALTDPETLDYVAYFTVEKAEFIDQSGKQLSICGCFEGDANAVTQGFLVENPDRMPNVHLHRNDFSFFPHIRLSGAGEILVEENDIGNCAAALFAQDLFKYWYESGRIRHLVYRNNRLYSCNSKGGSSFMTVAIDGLDPATAPKVHDTVEIYGNTFIGLKKRAIKAFAVKHLVVRDNTYDLITPELIELDGVYVENAQNGLKT